MHIAPYAHADGFGGHDPERRRKLLLHRRRDRRAGAAGRSRRRSPSCPCRVYFKDGRAKVELALARGRKRYDKRHAIAERDANREAERAMASAGSEREGGATAGAGSTVGRTTMVI